MKLTAFTPIAVSIASFLGSVSAVPAQPKDARALSEMAQRGAELYERLQARTPHPAWFEERVGSHMKRGESPIASDPTQLTAASHAKGGQNYTGYKDPVPAEFTRNPKYAAFSAFDFHSLNLGVHQEQIELDLFLNAVKQFGDEDFRQLNLTSDDQALLHFFGLQEIGHAEVLSNLLGPKAPQICKYDYPYSDLRGYLDFNEQLTRWGESGVYGFLPSLDNRANAQILLQSIATEARQQYTFRQWLGVQPVTQWFETGLPQAYAWTLLSRYISSCPSHNIPVQFTIFPRLDVQNSANIAQIGEQAGGAAITHNTDSFVQEGDTVKLAWDSPGKNQGPYGQKTAILADDKTPRYAAFLSQYNVTYSPLEDISHDGSRSYGSTKVPGGLVFSDQKQPIVAGTMFVSITNSNSHYTPLNLTLINGATIAGPAIFQAS